MTSVWNGVPLTLKASSFQSYSAPPGGIGGLPHTFSANGYVKLCSIYVLDARKLFVLKAIRVNEPKKEVYSLVILLEDISVENILIDNVGTMELQCN